MTGITDFLSEVNMILLDGRVTISHKKSSDEDSEDYWLSESTPEQHDPLYTTVALLLSQQIH